MERGERKAKEDKQTPPRRASLERKKERWNPRGLEREYRERYPTRDAVVREGGRGGGC